MNAPARICAPHSPPVARVDPVKVLVARAEARAMLWFDGDLDLHDAVDELWASAVRDGLVDKLGADEVQRLLADAFAPLRTDLQHDDDVVTDPIGEDEEKSSIGTFNPADDEYDGLPSTFAKACRKADEKQRSKSVAPRITRARQLLDDDVSLDQAWRELNNPPSVPIVSSATLEAAEYLHDQGDLEAFKRWFDRHNAAEQAAIFRHLNGRKRGQGK
jgi:hypothetical protein